MESRELSAGISVAELLNLRWRIPESGWCLLLNCFILESVCNLLINLRCQLPPHKVIPTTFSPMNFSSVIGFSMKSKSTSTQTDEKRKCIFPFPLSKEFFIMKNPSNIQQQFFLFCFSFCRWFLFRLTDDSMGKKATKWSDMTAWWWIFQHWHEWKIDTLLKEGRV